LTELDAWTTVVPTQAMPTTPSTREKALKVNLDGISYGTFAEIGGGQEVARWFFFVGGAAGTVAKTISAYDMAVSDALYGRTARYVSRQRLESMLAHEFDQLVESLGPTRGAATAFFAFGNTVTTRSHAHDGNGRGWVGLRFQSRPRAVASDIIVHVHLFDVTTVGQQEALGVLGVNLVHAAFFHSGDRPALVGALMDGLSRARVEIDMIKLSGPVFAGVDNRLMSLQLVEQSLTDAAMFTAAGEVVQPAEVLYKRPILVERGTFRPVTRVSLDVLERARDLFVEEPGVKGTNPIVLAEMTLRRLQGGDHDQVDHVDFLARADLLCGLGFDVLISRFRPYYQLADYLAAYTDRMIGIAVGLQAIQEIVDEKYYKELAGGVLESLGRLFKRSVKMYVYPMLDPVSGEVVSAERETLPPPWTHLEHLLLEAHMVEPIHTYNKAYLPIGTADVLARIQRGDPTWEAMVPPTVAEIIKAKKLFGFEPSREHDG
jgi:hypothetical protein